jgi:diacylglycerol kinase (ATP)
LKRLYLATINSWNGLKFAIRSEQAIREELVALLLAIPLAFIVGTTAVRRLELVVVLLLLIAVELLNTAIEKLSDRLTREIDPQIRDVKDMGSAAVLAALVIAGATWLFALAERVGLL